MDTKKTQLYFFFLLFLAVAIVCFLIFLPYLGILVLTLSLAVAVEPWHNKVLNFCGGHRGVAAFLTLLMILLVFLIPLTFIGLQIFNEARSLFVYLSFNQGAALGPIIQQIKTVWPTFNFDPGLFIQQFLGLVTTNFAVIFSSTISTLLQVVLGLIALFFFLRDGDLFIRSLVVASPLADEYDEKIIAKLKGAINAVVRGQLLIALIQALFVSAGFIVFGLPNPVLWGSLAGLCVFVPIFSTSVVTVPSVIFLYFNGHPLNALGLLIWALMGNVIIDNMLSPHIIGRGLKIHSLFSLFAIIGGIILFGPMGILLGPLAISLFFVLMEIYRSLAVPKTKKKI